MKTLRPLAFLSILPLLASCSLIEGSGVDDITDDGADAFAKIPTLINIDDPAAVSDLFEIVLDASYIAMQAHIEVQASSKHDLQGISNGEEVAAPTDNVGETLDACVEVTKALDEQDGEEHLILDLSYELCAEDGRAGGLDIRGWWHEATVTDPAPDDPASDPLVVQPSSMELILLGYKQGSLRFDGIVNWEGVSDAAAGIFRYEEDGAYTVEVDVANALGSNDLAVAIPLQVTQVVSGGIDAAGVFAATGTAVVEAQGRTADLTFFLSSSPEACPDGGLSGKIVITRDGASRELPLNCWDAAGKAGLYRGKDYASLKFFNAASCVGCDLKGADLSPARLPGVNLSNADLSVLTTIQPSPNPPKLTATKLGGNYFGAKFIGANLTGLTMTEGCNAADFSEYDGCVNFHVENFLVLPITNLAKADFTGATLTDASFNSADLTGAMFVNTIGMPKAFRYCDLRGAFFPSTNLEGVDFTGSICPDGSWPDPFCPVLP